MSKVKKLSELAQATIPTKLPVDWQKNVDEKWWSKANIRNLDFPDGPIGGPEAREKFIELHDRLLAIGGAEVCFPDYEEDMDKILKSSYLRNGQSKLMRGEPSHCHSNVCNLWEQNHGERDVRICTGYALSKDGMWRCHSWLLHCYDTGKQRREQVVETTEKREAYYGFEMSDEEAREFCANNY